MFGGQQYDHSGDAGKEAIAGVAAPERCSTQRGFCSATEVNHKILDGVGRSLDLSDAR